MNYLNPHTHNLDQDIERTDATGRVLYEIARERSRQDARWGEQNHPDGTGGGNTGPAAIGARLACQIAAKDGTVSWRDILREEVAEAFAETDPVRLRAELIQVAAVAVNWIEAIDRRAGGDR